MRMRVSLRENNKHSYYGERNSPFLLHLPFYDLNWRTVLSVRLLSQEK